MIVWLCWVYDAITNFAPLRLHAAIGNAWGVLHLEQALHLDTELGLDRWLAGQPRPKRFRIACGSGVHALIGRDRVIVERLGWRKRARFVEQVIELGVLVGHAGILLHPSTPLRVT